MRVDQLASMIDGKLVDPMLSSREFRGVSIDSRTLKPGELFVALHGEHTDGHDYVPQAIEAGAAAIMVEFSRHSADQVKSQVPVVEVSNSHEAMINLACDYRDTVGAKRIGVTGSNGKTTTKEMLFRLLEAVEDRVYRSPGNYNNLYGMPLAIMSMPQETKLAVLEMGISRPGEMEKLAEIVRPDLLCVTNVGPTHLEFLGSVRGVARAKLEAVKTMSSDQPVVINADDPVLVTEARRFDREIVTFGIDADADFRPDPVDLVQATAGEVSIEGHRFHISLFGQYQVYNLLAAYATVRTLGYDLEGIDTYSLKFKSSPMRGETVNYGGMVFIVDCYNANPESVKAGLQSFARYPAKGRRVVVLGDMLELGVTGEQLHRELGRQLAVMNFDQVVLVGSGCAHAAEEALANGCPPEELLHCANVKECSEALAAVLQSDDTVYIKGSRGLGLERILQLFNGSEGEA
ncbi:MAG: UDP-N-acetylmuramoyl-tripeptide--D-alanyl-D-alanine ligase [Candidatus Zixiibacteriota bacterium]|nr:MAG: UDP-N-acetylmuramoyl-tripeptide--D-alanyl-D-alanine ligase [candidate division Zixibacteria bacterium]